MQMLLVHVKAIAHVSCLALVAEQGQEGKYR